MRDKPLSTFPAYGLVAGLISLGLIGCAGTPPTDELELAESAVNQAESSDAQELAPRELHAANQKLDAARAAMQGGDYEEARQLAQQAEIDAQLAEKKAQSEKVQKSVNDVRAGIRELNTELSN